MSKFVPITTAASALGVSATTLRRWEASGRLVPARTAGGQRRYDLAALRSDLAHGALASDVLEIITVFSARLYGSRSHGNRKLIDGVRRAVREAQC